MKRLLCIALAVLVLCGCAAAPAQTTSGPVLKPGFYVPEGEESASLLLYLELKEGGQGICSIMGMTQSFEWAADGADFGDMTFTPTADGLVAEDSVPMAFTYTGDALPEGYLPDPPAPGIYAISSVGYQGDMEIFGALTAEDNCLELRADGTGELRFRGSTYPLTWDGITASFETFGMLLMDLGVTTPDDPALVMGYITEGECPIEADSIAFRLLEGE